MEGSATGGGRLWPTGADVHCENAFYFLPCDRVAALLRLPLGRDASGHQAYVYKGPWRHVWVEYYEYPITSGRAWLPEHHAYVGKMGTRVQIQAEVYLDLLSFRLYLHGRIERKYQVPGENRWA